MKTDPLEWINPISHLVKGMTIFFREEPFTYLDSGSTRHVFVNVDKTKVLKILVDGKYQDWNLDEYERYRMASEETKKKMAFTELVEGGQYILQEYCTPLFEGVRSPTIPELMFAGQCRNEVGWNQQGDLVCFDLDEFKKY